MGEDELPSWLVAAYQWSDSWWYSLVRAVLSAVGVIAFIGGILIGFTRFWIGISIALIGAAIGPHWLLALPQFWPVPECAAAEITFGGQWFDNSCDLFSGASSMHYTSPESMEAREQVAAIESSWWFQLIGWLVFIWAVWLFSEPVRSRLYSWWQSWRAG